MTGPSVPVDETGSPYQPPFGEEWLAVALLEHNGSEPTFTTTRGWTEDDARGAMAALHGSDVEPVLFHRKVTPWVAATEKVRKPVSVEDRVRRARQVPATGGMRALVLEQLVRHANDDAYPDGMTDEELQRQLGVSGNSERPRRGELVLGGWVADAGVKRNGDTVWTITTKTRDSLERLGEAWAPQAPWRRPIVTLYMPLPDQVVLGVLEAAGEAYPGLGDQQEEARSKAGDTTPVTLYEPTGGI